MTSGKRAGRTVGVLLLLHLAVGLIVPFILLYPLVMPGFLAGAAGAAGQIRAGVLMLFVGSALAIAIAAAAWPVVRPRSAAMAVWLVALAIASFTLQAVDNSHILSMLSLSQQYAQAGPAKGEVLQTMAVAVASARKWAHYSFLVAVGCWIFLLFSLLYRFRLVPRVLATFGMIGALLQIAGVTLRGLLGYPPETRLAMPLAPIYVALALWLIVKGFDERELSERGSSG